MTTELKKVLIIFKSGAKTTVEMTEKEFQEMRRDNDEAIFHVDSFTVARGEIVFLEILEWEKS